MLLAGAFWRQGETSPARTLEREARGVYPSPCDLQTVSEDKYGRPAVSDEASMPVSFRMVQVDGTLQRRDLSREDLLGFVVTDEVHLVCQERQNVSAVLASDAEGKGEGVEGDQLGFVITLWLDSMDVG